MLKKIADHVKNKVKKGKEVSKERISPLQTSFAHHVLYETPISWKDSKCQRQRINPKIMGATRTER